MSNIGSVGTLNVFTGKPCNCGHGGWCNCPQTPKLPYLVVPREAPVAAPLVRTEVEILRERVAAMEAQIAALTAHEPAPVSNVMARAISRWPGSKGFIQGIRWRGGI